MRRARLVLFRWSWDLLRFIVEGVEARKSACLIGERGIVRGRRADKVLQAIERMGFGIGVVALAGIRLFARLAGLRVGILAPAFRDASLKPGAQAGRSLLRCFLSVSFL